MFFGGGGGKLPHNAGTGVPGDGSVHCAECRLPRDDPSHRTTGSKCSSAHSCAKETMCAAAWGADVHSAGLLRHPFVHVPFAFVHKCTPIPPPRVFLPVFTFFFFFLSAARGGCNLSQCLEVFSGNRLECISCRNVGPRWLVRLKLHNDCLVNPSQNARRYVIVQSFVPKSLKKKSDTAVRQLPGGMVGSKWTFLRFGLALLRCSKLQILLLLVAAQLGVACQLHSVYLEQGSILHLQMYFIQLCHSDSIYKSRHSQVCVLLDLDGFGQWKSSWVTVLDILVTYIYT